MKKFTSIFMAVAMVLALALPALAANPTPSIAGSTASGGTVSGGGLSYTSQFAGEYQETVIDISLPNNVSLVLNPYRLEYSASSTHSGDSNAFLVDKLADQLFSAPLTVESRSNIALKVDMEVKPVINTASDMKLADSENTFDEQEVKEAPDFADKMLYLTLEYGLVDEANQAPGADKKVMELTEDNKEKSITELQEGEAGNENWFVTIPPAPTGTTKYFGFKFNGKATTNVASPGYDSNDTIDASIAFTFIPVANDPDQIQADAFFKYKVGISTASGGTVNTADLVAVLPESAKLTPQTDHFIVKSLKWNNTGIDDNDAAGYVALNKDGMTLTIKPQKVWEFNEAAVAVGGKYAVVIPIEFNAHKDNNDATGTPVKCNVRVIFEAVASGS